MQNMLKMSCVLRIELSRSLALCHHNCMHQKSRQRQSLYIDCNNVNILVNVDIFSLHLVLQDLYRFDDGQVAYDCSLRERFTGPMIPLIIKKIITMWDAMPASERGFKSEFAKKAWADLLAYEESKADRRSEPL